MLENFLDKDLFEDISSLFTNQDIASFETASSKCKNAATKVWVQHQKTLEGLFKDKPSDLTAKEFTVSHEGLDKLSDLRKEYFAKEIYSPEDHERIRYVNSFGLEGHPVISDFSFYVKNGCFKSVQFLLANFPIADQMRSKAVIEGAKNNQEDIVELLLENGSISRAARKSAFEKAGKNHNFTIAKMLFESGSLSSTDIYTAATHFVGSGSREAVSYLLDNCDDFTDDDYGDLLFLAGKGGHKNIVELLFGRTDFSYEDLTDAFYNSFRNGHLNVTEWLLDECYIPKEALGDALFKAAAFGSKALINKILSKTTLKPEQRGEAVCAALDEGRNDIARFLASTGPIPNTYLKFALETCVRNGSYQSLNFLISTYKNFPPRQTYQYILRGTDILIRPEMLTTFLLDHTVPQDLIEDSIILATLIKKWAVVQSLLDYRPVSDKLAMNLLHFSVKVHHHPTIARLLRDRRFQGELIQSLLVYARNTRDSMAVEMLSGHAESPEDPRKKIRTR